MNMNHDNNAIIALAFTLLALATFVNITHIQDLKKDVERLSVYCVEGTEIHLTCEDIDE